MATFTFEEATGASPEKKRKAAPKPGKGRSESASSTTVSGTLPKDPSIRKAIEDAADEFGVPREYGFALAEQESSYNPKAHNGEFGAAGMFQYIPKTAKARGIDPYDVTASARAAMKDFSEASEKYGGVEEAIKHHFAGPDKRGHGPKTRQYLADVTKRATDIAGLLGGAGISTAKASAGELKPGEFSFEEAVAAQVPSAKAAPAAKPATEEAEEESGGILDTIGKFASEQFGPSEDAPTGSVVPKFFREPVAKAGKASFDHVRNRLLTDLGQIPMDSPDYRPRKGVEDPFGEARDIRKRQEERTATAGAPPAQKGFLANLENPMKLITEDSLPANFIEALARAPEHERQKFTAARQVMMQQNIVDNPDDFPDVAVEAAQQAIDKRLAKQDPTIRKMWNDLKKAAKEDPGKFAATFANALMADPELIAAPMGLGTKIVATTRVAAGATVGGRVTRVVDKILDAASVEAALNVGIEAGQAASEGVEFTSAQARQSAAIGAVAGGLLGPIFSRGAVARDAIQNGRGKLTPEEFEQHLRDVAAEENAVEDIVEGTSDAPADVKARIEQSLGIVNRSAAERKSYLAKRGKELRKTFADESAEADYLAFKAEERMLRSQQFAEEQAASAAAAEARSIAEQASQAAAARVETFDADFDAALAARADAEAVGMENEARALNEQIDMFHKAETDAVMEDLLNGDIPSVKRMLNSASRRDAKMRTPKWQRGEVDPNLIARAAVVTTGVAAGVALAPEEQKMQGGFLFGLAGLVIPGGGRVLSRMRQSGAISPEGDIVSRLIGEGKLKPDVDMQAKKAAEAEVIERAKAGDQLAYKALYEDNYPRMERMAAKLLRDAGPKLGIDPSDIAQDAFIKAFQSLDKFDGRAQFSTWIHSIVRNEGLQAIRKATAEKHGGALQFVSQDMPSLKDAGGEYTNRTLMDEGLGADMHETPETLAMRQDVEAQLVRAFDKLPDDVREALRLTQIELLTDVEAAAQMGRPLATVQSWVARGKKEVAEALAKDMSAKPDAVEAPRRGRGRPPGSKNKQAGYADTNHLKAIAGVTTMGALAAWATDVDMSKPESERNSRMTAALVGAGTGALLFASGGRGIKSLGQKVDELAGASSTRILNSSAAIHKRIVSTERKLIGETHRYIETTGDFLRSLKDLDKTTSGVLTRALMTGNAKVITKVLDAIGDPKLKAGYKQVRSTLDSLGDQLVAMKRFSKGNFEYFPRIITDLEGLFAHIGKEETATIKGALEAANIESLRKNGRPISQLEEAAIVNQKLFLDIKSTQPGWSKDRGIEEITPEMQKFYASPAESLHTYIRSAVQDIERAKFFGTYARNMKKGQNEYLDVDRSVNNLIAEEIRTGKLSQDQAREIGSILKSRFGMGEHGELELIRNFKNMANIGLLGNFWSAATQLADIGITVFTQGLKPTLTAVARQATNTKLVNMKDFGLVDHISEEFANQLKTTRWVNRVFKLSLFAGVDQVGKNTTLNAAIIKAQGWAKTPQGQLKLANKYRDAFGPDFQALVSDLKGGKITELTRDYAFMELSRSQPVSRIEMPQIYLDHPNARSYLWLKSFTMKQVDLMRREAYNEMKAGNVAKGLKNMTNLGIMMGLSGATTGMIKDFMLGNDVEFKASDIPLNMFKTLGWSEYQRDQFAGVSKEEAKERRDAGDERARTRKAEPLQAIMATAVPPFKLFDELVRGDSQKARRFMVPLIGPYLAEQYKKVQDMQEEAEKN